jgi:hypothetical protein
MTARITAILSVLFLTIGTFLHAYLVPMGEEQQAIPIAVPIIMAAVKLGSAIAKGIKRRRAAKKREKEANKLKIQGEALEQYAWKNRKDYTTPQELFDAKNLAMNQYNSRETQEAMEANAEAGVGNILSQVKRSSSTTGEALSGAMVAEQMRQGGYREAAIMGAQERSNSLNSVLAADNAIADSKNREYQYNTLMPFALNYERGVSLQNAGMQGKIVADNMKVEAFADIMNGVGAAADTVASMYGAGMFGGGGGGGSVAQAASGAMTSSGMKTNSYDMFSAVMNQQTKSAPESKWSIK